MICKHNVILNRIAQKYTEFGKDHTRNEWQLVLASVYHLSIHKESIWYLNIWGTATYSLNQNMKNVK